MSVEVFKETRRGPFGIVRRNTSQGTMERGQIKEFNLGSGCSVGVWHDTTGGLELVSTGDQPVKITFSAEPQRRRPEVVQTLTPDQPEIHTGRRRVTIEPAAKGKERVVLQGPAFKPMTVDVADAIQLVGEQLQRNRLIPRVRP